MLSGSRPKRVIWRECTTDMVVVARVFSRILKEEDIELEIARIGQFDFRTYFWSWHEQEGRYRMVYCFETPVHSTSYFDGNHGIGLLWTGGQISLPSGMLEKKQVNIPNRYQF